MEWTKKPKETRNEKETWVADMGVVSLKVVKAKDGWNFFIHSGTNYESVKPYPKLEDAKSKAEACAADILIKALEELSG